jgi:hypothetical protein
MLILETATRNYGYVDAIQTVVIELLDDGASVV